MDIAVTGATGFLGRYIVNHLLAQGHRCRCWHRPGSDRGGFVAGPIDWVQGRLNELESTEALVAGTQAVVHAALDWSGAAGASKASLIDLLETNLLGSIRLIQTARAAGTHRFIFISSCSVHEQILDDRPLDEAHPLWPHSHYGAHKAAIEKFVHSVGLGEGYQICALRPTGIYGLARPVSRSRWHSLVQSVAAGEDVNSEHGGKEVHAADVARAVEILLGAKQIGGQVYNCYDMYIAEQDVAQIAKELSSSPSQIALRNQGSKHQIVTEKLRALGVRFGGKAMLRQTIRAMLNSAGA